MIIKKIITLVVLLTQGMYGLAQGIYGEQKDEKDAIHPDAQNNIGELLNQKVDEYRGLWYMNQPLDNEYKYKYSGGLGTYPQQHNPIAIYSKEVNKTFFCYGGTDAANSTLFYMVSYYDHATGKVPKPTLVLNKNTTDAHDNPIISIDNEGYIWLFGNSHGLSRPSYVLKSKSPYDIDTFEIIPATKQEEGKEVAMNNFSYMQAWHLPDKGFVNFFTRYKYPADRTICFMTSKDGQAWSSWQRLAAIKKGHYQISTATSEKAGSAFDFHPDDPDRNGLNYRTNIYYVETHDFGKTWQTADGKKLDLPLTDIDNPALVHDYYRKKQLVYLKDIQFDEQGHPIILYMTSQGFEAGPENDPRTWHTARWTGQKWEIRDITTSDNNYDHGSLYLEADGTWKVIGPTQTGPQPYNPGGEMALWVSHDQGKNWEMVKQMTVDSEYNHTYARRPMNAHDDFYAIWADGHGRQPSESRIYISDKEGNVFMLPQHMEEEMVKLDKMP
ncbi:BNR-4 repeat-containing protein [Catalinimonas niigatensis]|uniref:BNR-4 repeat-containing protein n=1 Tax=Catalinimonas niigatensis TaxID=1397264 RepID=UPI002666A3DB|nr:BNR-4 repeat-containing protein [Catalinimonas niigatensis]WPP51911.1 BNR-4 repeat-containing protein [Catalinimonas niigatensis]